MSILRDSLVGRFVRRMLGEVPDLPSLPVAPRQMLVTARDGVRLRAHDFGPEDAPVVCLFAHGFTLTSRSWFFQVEHVLREYPGLRVVVPDLRGHGRTDIADGELSVDATARDLVDLAEEFQGARAVLVGHSLGVMSVLGMLRFLPDAQRGLVSGLVLINGAIDSFASRGLARVLNLLPVRALRKAGAKVPRPLHSIKSGMEWLIKPVIAGFVYHGALEEGASAQFDVVDFHTAEIKNTALGTVLGFLDDLVLHDETAAAPLLQGKPGVVMAGGCDDVTPPQQSVIIHRLWKEADLRICENAGHMLPVECPEAVNAALDTVLAPLMRQHDESL